MYIRPLEGFMDEYEVLWSVEVDVALNRPPRNDRTIGFLFAGADNPIQAEMSAVTWANETPGVVMAVGSRIVKMVL